ncbi:MAG: tetratricopeptide repeat protein [Betaproteobacteria bacterium]|nr:tetratricopeptide repeat protein [Betaproteobacteria bacterium]
MSLLIEALKKAEENRRLHPDGYASGAPDSMTAENSSPSFPYSTGQIPPGKVFPLGRLASGSRRHYRFLWPALIIAGFAVGFGVASFGAASRSIQDNGTRTAAVSTPQEIPREKSTPPQRSANTASEAGVFLPLSAPSAKSFSDLAKSLAEKKANPETSPAIKTPPPEKPEATRSVVRSPAPDLLDPALDHAYQALRQGKNEEAEQAYRQLLRQNPEETDAMTGLGVLALRRGANEEAESWFRQTLAVDPKNALALAGMETLATLAKSGDPVAVESKIKTLLADQPDVAVLHFALGNALARQERWAEAQEAYFHAWRTEPENPDYAFNLAVGLDHLHQARQARHYYELALQHANAQAQAGFIPENVRRRLDALRIESPSD